MRVSRPRVRTLTYTIATASSLALTAACAGGEASQDAAEEPVAETSATAEQDEVDDAEDDDAESQAALDGEEDDLEALLRDAGFSADLIQESYPSDELREWILLLDGFDLLLDEHPEVLEQDMELVVSTNNNADDEQRARAIEDQYEDMSVTMADGLGEHLGEIYETARIDGRTPLTEALISRDEQRAAGPNASSNPPKDHWDHPRPYLQEPDSIEYFDREDGDAHDTTSGAYPSGHTSQAYWQGVFLATLLPELADGMLARTSEAGHNRVVMGVHYPLDVVGGRMMGTAIAAERWNDEEFRPLLLEAREELVDLLESECGASLEECVAQDEPYAELADAAAVYEERMTYGFPQIGEAGQPMDVPESAPALLLTAHPDLNDEQRRQVLELTAIDSGFPLDKDGPDGGWQRLNLLAAMTATVEIDDSGDVVLVD